MSPPPRFNEINRIAQINVLGRDQCYRSFIYLGSPARNRELRQVRKRDQAAIAMVLGPATNNSTRAVSELMLKQLRQIVGAGNFR
jgi:hypothetical protein